MKLKVVKALIDEVNRLEGLIKRSHCTLIEYLNRVKFIRGEEGDKHWEILYAREEGLQAGYIFRKNELLEMEVE